MELRIVIPLSVTAAVNATHERKMAEAKQTAIVTLPTQNRRDDCVVINEAADVTDEMIAESIELFEMYFDSDESIDWQEFWNKLESVYKLTVISTECGAVRKIQRKVRNHRDSV